MSLVRAFLNKFGNRTRAEAASTAAPRKMPALREIGALERLHHQRQLLEITLDDSQRRYQSLIVALDHLRGIIWLDELFPQQRLISVGDQVHVCHRLGEQILRFSSPVIAMGDDYGASGIALLLPDRVKYQPRRAWARVDLNDAAPVSAKIRAVSDDVRYGTLDNLSAGGMCLRIPGHQTHLYRHDDELPLCELTLPHGKRIRCRARVRGLSLLRTPYLSMRLHLEFLALSEENQREIDAFVSEFSREKNFRQYAA